MQNGDESWALPRPPQDVASNSAQESVSSSDVSQGCMDLLYWWTCLSQYRGPSVLVQGVAGPGTVLYKYDLTRSNFAEVKAVVICVSN